MNYVTLTGAHSQGSPSREELTWDCPEPRPRELLSPTMAVLDGKPGHHPPALLHPAQAEGTWAPALVHSTTVSLPHRALSGDLALSLHNVSLRALKSLGSEEQIARWAPLWDKFQIISTYAQTELGHGERCCCVRSAQVQRARRVLSRWSQICTFNMEMLQQGAVKGLEGGRVSFSDLYRCYGLAVRQVVPSGNVSNHCLSWAGHVSPTQPMGKRR